MPLKSMKTHIKWLKRFFLLFLCCVSAACSPDLPAYVYKSQPDSATIRGIAIESEDLLVLGPKVALMPIAIDGQKIDTPHGGLQDILFKWPGEDTLSLNIIQRPIILSPGKHEIKFVLFGTDKRTERFAKASFVALENERYQVKQSTRFEHMIGTDFPTFITFWIEDSKGNKVTERQTVQMYEASR